MLRITKINESHELVTLFVEGRIEARWVSELKLETDRWLRRGCRVVLDFAGVKFVGAQGAEMVSRLAGENVKIINCSALIKRLLSAAT